MKPFLEDYLKGAAAVVNEEGERLVELLRKEIGSGVSTGSASLVQCAVRSAQCAVRSALCALRIAQC